MRLQTSLLASLVALALAIPGTARAHEAGFPEKTLKSTYPQATGFTTRTKTLTADQVKKIEAAVGTKLGKEDNPLTFYVALGKPADGSGVLGIVVIADGRGPKGAIDLALGVKRDGTLENVVVTTNKDEPALSTPAFLDQLKGKTTAAPLALGKDIKYSGDPKSAEALLAAVRRGLQLAVAAIQ